MFGVLLLIVLIPPHLLPSSYFIIAILQCRSRPVLRVKSRRILCRRRVIFHYYSAVSRTVVNVIPAASSPIAFYCYMQCRFVPGC